MADALVELVTPIRERYMDIQKNKKENKESIKESSIAIRARAAKTLAEVRELTGLTNLK